MCGHEAPFSTQWPLDDTKRCLTPFPRLADEGAIRTSHRCDYGSSVQSGEESPQLDGGPPEVICLRPLPPGRTTQM